MPLSGCDKLIVEADKADIPLVAECCCRVESSHVSFFHVDNIDQEHEWHQLKETYGQMTEDELSDVAEDAYDLTPIAREVLQAEIAARGLGIQMRTAPAVPAPDINVDDLVCLRQLWDADEAKRVKGILDAASIPSFLGAENVLHLEDFKSGFENGVELKVPTAAHSYALATLEQADSGEDEVESADRLLRGFRVFHRPARAEDEDQDQEDKDDPPEDGEGYVMLCPKCQAMDVIFEELDREGPANEKFNWRCANCGHRWKDDGVEKKL